MRDAILQASFFLQEHPEKFRFRDIMVPRSERGTGCALGWIGYFSGQQGHYVHTVSERLLGISDYRFYFRMDWIAWMPLIGGVWTTSGRACARTLRRYADKYFPDPTGMKEYMYV